MLLFRNSELLQFNVSVTNMLHIFLEQNLFVCQDRKLKFSTSDLEFRETSQNFGLFGLLLLILGHVNN